MGGGGERPHEALRSPNYPSGQEAEGGKPKVGLKSAGLAEGGLVYQGKVQPLAARRVQRGSACGGEFRQARSDLSV